MTEHLRIEKNSIKKESNVFNTVFFTPPRIKFTPILLITLALASFGTQGCRWDDSLYTRYVGGENKDVQKCDYNVLSLRKGRYIKKFADNDYRCGNYKTIIMDEASEKASCTPEEIALAKEAMEEYGLCTAEAHNCVKQVGAEGLMCSDCREGEINLEGTCTPITDCPNENDLKCRLITTDGTNKYETADAFEQDFVCLNTQENSAYCGWKSCENRENIPSCTNTQSCKEGECKTFEAKCEGESSLSCTIDGEIKCINKSGTNTCGATSCDEDGLGKACEGDLICLNEKGDCGCPSDRVQNGIQCLDPNHPSTCGATKDFVGKTCDSNQTCIAGECVCNTGWVMCGDICVSPKSKEFCGADATCENYSTCKEDEECVDGVCLCASQDMVKCGDACIPRNNNAHCGASGLCHDSSYLSQNFIGYICSTGKKQCINLGDDDYECLCNEDESFDKISGKCKFPDSDAEFCGTAKINCKLTYGDNAICRNGTCTCPSGWLTVDSSLKEKWGTDWDLDDDYTRCIDSNFDNRFCGATRDKRTDADQDIRPCKKNEMCYFGKCVEANEATCAERSRKLCNNQCMNLDEHNMINCSTCKSGSCSFEELARTEGCHAIEGQNCNCKDDKILVYYDEYKYAKCAPMEGLHVNIAEGKTSRYICQDGWANANTKHQNYDGSFNITDRDGCEINIASDPSNCGAIGHRCGDENSQLHMMPLQCLEGTCVFQCFYNEDHNYGDCNNDLDASDGNGCEIDLFSDKNNCGQCGNKCTKSRICNHGICCFGTGDITDDIKSYGCCSGLKRYRKCVAKTPGICWNYHYQCFEEEEVTSLDADWKEYK